MTRRTAILACLSLPLGDYKALAAQSGILTVPLDKWRAILVTLGDETVEIPVDDIFNVLKGENNGNN